VEYVPVTPSGEWLVQRAPKDPDDSESDDDVSFDKAPSWARYVQIPAEDRKSRTFRHRIIGKFANELYGSAGLAALQMPKLKCMQLETTGGGPYHQFNYKVIEGAAKITWGNYEAWDRPLEPMFQLDDQVLEVWRKVSFEHTGGELDV
jgi:hypothetical protein